MAKFKLTKRRYETGINWADETRIYTLRPKISSWFSRLKYDLELDDFGSFYFTGSECGRRKDKKSLPESRSSKIEKIFTWLEENAIDKVQVQCRRDYGMEPFGFTVEDTCRMVFKFAAREDLIAFKMWC